MNTLKPTTYRLTAAQDRALDDLCQRGLIAKKVECVRSAVEQVLESKYGIKITDYQEATA